MGQCDNACDATCRVAKCHGYAHKYCTKNAREILHKYCSKTLHKYCTNIAQKHCTNTAQKYCTNTAQGMRCWLPPRQEYPASVHVQRRADVCKTKRRNPVCKNILQRLLRRCQPRSMLPLCKTPLFGSANCMYKGVWII